MPSQNQLFTASCQNQLLGRPQDGQGHNDMFDPRHVQVNMTSINDLTDQELRSQMARSSRSHLRSAGGILSQIHADDGTSVDYKRMYQNALNLVRKQQAQLSVLLQRVRQQQDKDGGGAEHNPELMQKQSCLIQ